MSEIHVAIRMPIATEPAAMVITVSSTVQRMVAAVLRGLGLRRFQRARVVACVAAEASDVERRAIEEAVTGAGAHAVTLVEEPLAAAVGAGLPISDPIGTLLVDIGGGKTQAAIVALGGVVSVRSSRIGGCDLDEAIRAHVVETYGVEIGEAAAEAIGARGLLVRVGAYFHDVGKMLKPAYFVENQGTGGSRHESLVPAMSTLIIVAHVKEGAELARQYTLPQPIVDLIAELYMTLNGIFGSAIDVSATLIVLFTIFGAVLQASGAGRFFIDFSLRAMKGMPRATTKGLR